MGKGREHAYRDVGGRATQDAVAEDAVALPTWTVGKGREQDAVALPGERLNAQKVN